MPDDTTTEAPLPTKDKAVTCQHCGAKRTVNLPDPLEAGAVIEWACNEKVQINDSGERVVVDGCSEMGGTILGPPAKPIPPIPPMKYDAATDQWRPDPDYSYDESTGKWVRA